MLRLPEAENFEKVEFKWGKKRGIGGKKKDVRFYNSFTFDGVDYALYDCVYMYKKGEPVPYIGKLVKIWENADDSKRIKVQWFFRPSEISYYLRDAKVLENELFFASGDGKGLANLNPLEAIAGKCNVVCISKDSRNPQPSAEELQMADYVFYRIFDVGNLVISDQMDDKVGGLEVKYVFNRSEGVRTLDGPKLDSNDKHEERNVVACEETLRLAGKNSTQQLNNVKPDKNSDCMLEEEDKNVMLVPVKQGSLPGEYSSGVDVISNKNTETTGTTVEERCMLGAKNVGCDICDVISNKNTETTGTTVEERCLLVAENVGCDIGDEKDELKGIKSPVSQVQVEERVKSARKSPNLDDASSKRAKFDGTVSSLKLQDTSSVKSLTIPGNDAVHPVTRATSFNAKPKSELVKDSVGCGKDANLAEKIPSSLDEKFSKKIFFSSKVAPKSGCAGDATRLQKGSKMNKDLNASQGKLSKSNSFRSIEKSESTLAKDSVDIEKDKKVGGNLSMHREKPSTTNVVLHDETSRPSTANVSPNETPKSGSNKDFEGLRQVENLVQSSSTSTKRPLKRSADLSKEKSSLGHEKSHENKDNKTLTNVLWPTEEASRKKAKFDETIKRLEENKNNTTKKLEEKNCVGETKHSPKLVTSYDNKAKSRFGEVALKEYHNDKNSKISNDNLPNPLITRSKDDGGTDGGQIIEVTRRPIERSNWIKLPWEDKMKTAHNQGRLVLLLNLDPEYTSGEVEDIIWHAFEEKCTARVVQQTAISDPHAGQAFVIFGSQEAADRVVEKLDDGCLMLPNQRPLVGCLGILPESSEKQTTFVGHLAIDKARRQIQREMKEAVSTSHYSQNNTIEYEMAMDWCLLQSKSDKWWEKLYQQQRNELKKLVDTLKPK